MCNFLRIYEEMGGGALLENTKDLHAISGKF